MSNLSGRIEQVLKNEEKFPRQTGKADYFRFLRGGLLTRDEAIRAKCYECVQGEDTSPCKIELCPLTLYCPWNRTQSDGGIAK